MRHFWDILFYLLLVIFGYYTGYQAGWLGVDLSPLLAIFIVIILVKLIDLYE